MATYPSANLYPAASGIYPSKPEALWIFDRYTDKITVSNRYNEVTTLPRKRAAYTSKRA